MSEIATGAGVDLAYAEQGAGAPILLIHGLAGDCRALAPLAGEIAQARAGGARVIAYSRRGYAGSGAPEPYLGTTVAEQTEDAAALLDALDATPALVAGDGFGALIALDLLLRHGGPRARRGPRRPAAVRARERRGARALRLAGAAARGGRRRWPGSRCRGAPGGAGRAADRERAEAAHAAFFADVAGLASLPVTRRELRAITQPVVVVTGPGSSAATVEAADALAELVPRARRALDGDLAGAAAGLLG